MSRPLNILITLQFAWFGLASEIYGEYQDLRDVSFAKHLTSALLVEGLICTLPDGETNGTCRQETSCLYLKTVLQKDWKTCSLDASSRIFCCPEKQPIVLQDGQVRSKYKSDEMCASFAEMSGTANHILSGIEAEIEDFPYLGALALVDDSDATNGAKYGCGASLISDRFVLTAASCVIDKRVDHVRFGTLTLEDVVGEGPVIIGIQSIIIYPLYYGRRTARNDIALIELNRAVVEDFLIPACLYTEPDDPLPSVPLTIAGWGSTDSNDAEMSPVLLKAQVSIYERDKCNSVLKRDSNRFRKAGLYSGQLCVLGKSDGGLKNAPCVGDTGGPLELSVGRRKYIVGITSSGKVCGTMFPSIYTRVSQYIGWIESIVWP